MEKDADGAVPTSIIVPESCHRSSTALGQGYLVGERERVKGFFAKERVSGKDYQQAGLVTKRLNLPTMATDWAHLVFFFFSKKAISLPASSRNSRVLASRLPEDKDGFNTFNIEY